MRRHQLEEGYFNQTVGSWCFALTTYEGHFSPFKIRRKIIPTRSACLKFHEEARAKQPWQWQAYAWNLNLTRHPINAECSVYPISEKENRW